MIRCSYISDLLDANLESRIEALGTADRNRTVRLLETIAGQIGVAYAQVDLDGITVLAARKTCLTRIAKDLLGALEDTPEPGERCDRCNELSSCFGPLVTCESCDSAVCRRCVSDDAALCQSCVSAQGRSTEWAVKGTAAERDFLPSGF